MDGWIDRYIDIDRQTVTDRQTDKQTGKQIDMHMYIYTYIYVHKYLIYMHVNISVDRM